MLVRKPEPRVTHLLTIAFAIVALHVDDEQLTAWFEHPEDFSERPLRFGEMMQHEHERRRIEPAVVYRKRLEVAAPQPRSPTVHSGPAKAVRAER